MRLPYLAPGETVWRFLYASHQELFRDHQNRRVVADAIGAGQFLVHELEGEIWVDGERTDERSGFYKSSFQALAEEGSNAKIELSVGRTEPVQPVFWKVPEAVTDFAGWALPPDGWSFPQPVYSLEGLDEEERIGSPASVIAVKQNAFFIADEEGARDERWSARNASAPELLGDFPAPFFQFLNEATFEVTIHPENEGLQVTRIFDAFHGRQRARVLVDGEPVGVWYNPFQNRHERIHADTFGISAKWTRGKERVVLTLDPPAGAPLWSACFYAVDALLPLRPSHREWKPYDPS